MSMPPACLLDRKEVAKHRGRTELRAAGHDGSLKDLIVQVRRDYRDKNA